MKVIRDEAYQRFVAAADAEGWTGVRIKDVRDRALSPGGRARLTLFEKVEDEDRPHPRLRTDMPPATDPTPPAQPLFVDPDATTAAAFRAALDAAIRAAAPILDGRDLEAAAAPRGSERFFRNSVRAQRVATLFRQATLAIEAATRRGALSGAELVGAWRALRELEAETVAGDLSFDDANTGTYHSFQHDAPFVHYLETLLASLPAEESEASATLPPEQQESVLRQRAQAQNHLDFLMRRKYANHGVTETDIEQTLGGLLIDKATRHIASETVASRGSLVPTYEILRVDPTSGHAHAGAWVFRGEDDALFLEDSGARVEVAPGLVRSVAVPAANLSFKRAPGDRRLRHGVRFDWDGNGYVSPTPIGWVSWAGHCDIKAIMEQLGLALIGQPSLYEHRSDTGATTTFDRNLLIEMIASSFELGSVYTRLDGSGRISRGIHRFGGARNDSLPDRLQFKGLAAGKSFRWPLAGRQDVFRVVRLEQDGQPVDLESAFFRYTPDLEALDFAPNPLFSETVEGDYNVIHVSGHRLVASVLIDDIDPHSGYPSTSRVELTLDLRDEATEPRIFLGTWLKDAARREIWKLYLNRAAAQIEGDAYVYTQVDGRWTAGEGQLVYRSPVQRPLVATLSREMKRDDPALFQALLSVALREAQNINADTDEQAEVWNGTVTSLRVHKLGANPDTRVERWRVALQARFGGASMEYLVRRAPDGTPELYCPLPGDRGSKAPDFLWQDFPDVGSKGVEAGEWVANASMVDRGIVEVRRSSAVAGGAYIYDDHVKNLFELIYCGLGGLPYTVVHNNKRYGFADEASWKAAVAQLTALREALRFEGAQGGGLVS